MTWLLICFATLPIVVLVYGGGSDRYLRRYVIVNTFWKGEVNSHPTRFFWVFFRLDRYNKTWYFPFELYRIWVHEHYFDYSQTSGSTIGNGIADCECIPPMTTFSSLYIIIMLLNSHPLPIMCVRLLWSRQFCNNGLDALTYFVDILTSLTLISWNIYGPWVFPLTWMPWTWTLW